METVNGREVIDGWGDKVAEAQKYPFVIINNIESFDRLAYGQEGGDTSEPCHDCAVRAGQFHVPGCDWERCPKCGGQAIGCDCGEDWAYATASLEQAKAAATVAHHDSDPFGSLE